MDTPILHPRTLLQIAGAARRPPPPERAILILVDMQAEYREGGGLKLPGERGATARAAALLTRARALGVPVLHVLHRGRAGGALFDPLAPGYAPLPEVAPALGEVVVEKALPNAFAGTDLLERIHATQRPEIVVAGFMTHMCVAATVKAALDFGIPATVAADACCTRPLPDPTGGPDLPADAVHRATLAALADRFAAVDNDIWAESGRKVVPGAG